MSYGSPNALRDNSGALSSAVARRDRSGLQRGEHALIAAQGNDLRALVK
jgi:hypothetical protein